MKTTLLFILSIAVPLMGQTQPTETIRKETSAEKALKALEGLQSARAILKDKEATLRIKNEAERPNYGGNAAAKTHNNPWLAILEGKTLPFLNQPTTKGD
jgi:hypothetical protein